MHSSVLVCLLAFLMPLLTLLHLHALGSLESQYGQVFFTKSDGHPPFKAYMKPSDPSAQVRAAVDKDILDALESHIKTKLYAFGEHDPDVLHEIEQMKVLWGGQGRLLRQDVAHPFGWGRKREVLVINLDTGGEARLRPDLLGFTNERLNREFASDLMGKDIDSKSYLDTYSNAMAKFQRQSLRELMNHGYLPLAIVDASTLTVKRVLFSVVAALGAGIMLVLIRRRARLRVSGTAQKVADSRDVYPNGN
jgi:hypothetical protein